ncbi:hypothetical protein V8E54_003314 [Elaphomyces granulatus]
MSQMLFLIVSQCFKRYCARGHFPKRHYYSRDSLSSLISGSITGSDRGTLTVNVDGLGPTFGESGFTIEDAKMLWDTGAQSTIIPKEILSDSFQEFLKKSVPDEYRSVNGFRVQVDIAIAFTELSLPLVVPKARLPNAFEGIIFRQKGCIDRLVDRTRERLKKKHTLNVPN